MARAEASIQIDRPVEEVWAYLTDWANWPRWAGEVVKYEQLSEGEVGEGTQLKGTGRFLGRTIEVVNELSAYQPNAKLAFNTIKGPVRGENTVTLERVDGGTRVTESIVADTGTLFGLADPLLARMIGRQFTTNLANLKDLLEAET